MKRKLVGLLLLFFCCVSILSFMEFQPVKAATKITGSAGLISSGDYINWPAFWIQFRQHVDWRLEWFDGSSWITVNGALQIVREYPEPNHCKITLVFTAPETGDYRLTFAVDELVKGHIKRESKFCWVLEYQKFWLTFDWSDLTEISDLQLSKGMNNGMFWFRIRRDNVPKGFHIELDPHLIIEDQKWCSQNWRINNSTYFTMIEMQGPVSGQHDLFRSLDSGVNWESVGCISETYGSNVSVSAASFAVDVNNNDITHISYQGYSTPYYIQYTRWNDDSEAFQQNVQITNLRGYAHWMEVDSNNVLHLIFDDLVTSPSVSTYLRYTNSSDGGSTWETPVLLDTNSWGDDFINPQLLITRNNVLNVKWRENDPGSKNHRYMYLRRWTNGTWSTAVDVAGSFDSTYPAGNSDWSSDPQDRLIYTLHNGSSAHSPMAGADIYVTYTTQATNYSGSLGWIEPVKASDGWNFIQDPSVQIDDSGAAHLMSQELPEGWNPGGFPFMENASLHYMRETGYPWDNWEAPKRLNDWHSQCGYGFMRGAQYPTIQRVISSDSLDFVFMVWQGVTGEYDIYYQLLSLVVEFDAWISNMEGCGNWLFADERYYNFVTETTLSTRGSEVLLDSYSTYSTSGDHVLLDEQTGKTYSDQVTVDAWSAQSVNTTWHNPVEIVSFYSGSIQEDTTLRFDVYASTGVYGSSAIPTGPILHSSDPRYWEWGAAPNWKNFTFSTPWEPTYGVVYEYVIKMLGGDGPTGAYIEPDNHDGNWADTQNGGDSWYTDGNYDMAFRLYGGVVSGLGLGDLHPTDTEYASSIGQTFTVPSNSNYYLTRVMFDSWVDVGSPAGSDAKIVLYDTTGTYGVDAVPSGSELATTRNYSISELDNDVGDLTAFLFSGDQQYVLEAGNQYAIVFRGPTTGTMDPSNMLNLTVNVNGTHSGNSFRYVGPAPHWDTTFSASDFIFYVYGEPIGTTLIDTVKIRFSDGVHTITAAYTVSSGIYSLEEGSDYATLQVGSASFYGDTLTVTFPIYLETTILDAMNVDLYMWVNSTAGYESEWIGVVFDYFNIYNLGGHGTLSVSGDAGRVTAGGIFELYADGTSGFARANQTWRKLQHFHALFAVWAPDGRDAIDSHENSYVEFGIDYCHNDTWLEGWKVRIVDEEADIGMHDWISLRIEWFWRGVSIKNDTITTNWDAWDGANQATDLSKFRLWVDLWIDKVNGSTTAAGRVNAYYFGMVDGGWIFWSDWRPKMGNHTQSMFFHDLTDANNDVVSAKTIEMMVLWAKVAKENLGGGGDEYRWEIRDLDILEISANPKQMEGINTPTFVETKTLEMPQGGFFAPLYAAINRFWGALASFFGPILLTYAQTLIGWMDTAAGFFGYPNFFSNLFSYLGHLFNGFIEGVLAFGNIIGTGLSFVTEWLSYMVSVIGDAFAQWLGMFQMGVEMIQGAFGVGVDLWETFNLSLWLTLAFILYPLYLVIMWDEHGLDRVISHLRVVAWIPTLVFKILSWLVMSFITILSYVIEAIPLAE